VKANGSPTNLQGLTFTVDKSKVTSADNGPKVLVITIKDEFGKQTRQQTVKDIKVNVVFNKAPPKVVAPVPGTTDATTAPVATDGTVAPVNADGTVAPVNADGTVAPVNADGTVAPVNADGTVAPVNADGTVAPAPGTKPLPTGTTRPG